ncbi:phospholipase D-like domain-containing protein [Nocardioides convexus]|uniref:phospholipase D-like domain-containing protein n=1 Tax=Nocardioides convexus TaxID=2712224 RepID=UPI002418B013|nr:phospholipase D-like domain-containing protein [Nocardioides convexus]
MEAGVRIYRYPAPFILHAKHFTIDDDVAVIGSSNMDMRSFGLNYEVSLMLPDPAVVVRLREVEDDYRAISKEPDARGVGRAPTPQPVRRQRHEAHRRAPVTGVPVT